VLFDLNLRAVRRDRAARTGPELFLLERAFVDCLERIELMQRRFASALLLGCPDPQWPARLGVAADKVEAADPGRLFGHHSGGVQVVEDDWVPEETAYDLVLAIGTLDTVNELPRALAACRRSLRPGGLLIGACSGGDTVPRLRSAMLAADRLSGAAAAHVHPRIEASALAPLLDLAGFTGAVVDVDRVQVRYGSLLQMVRDLRAMAATNLLVARPRRALTRKELAAAEQNFASDSEGRTTETFEILHFAAWAAHG
jgi:SAM-dependent methyltransferase